MAISIEISSVQEFGGEFNRTSPKYQYRLQFVSVEARTKNYRLVQKNGQPMSVDEMKKAMFRMGRDPKHISSPHFDGASELCHRVKVGAAGFKALDIFYNWGDYYSRLAKERGDVVAELWIGGMENRQAVSNRQKIVINELIRLINEFSKREEEVRIFSLAGGDGQTIIKAIEKSGKRNIKVLLLDPDREALRAAQKNAENAGLADLFTIKRGLASTAKRMAKDFQPHIFDVVGLLDYLDDNKVVEVVEIAKESLCSGGTLITCNIINNKERTFLENVLLWFMIYREPEEFGQLLLSGGFQEEKIKIILEPFRIHAIAVCQK